MWFLRSDTFADGMSYLSKFLDASKFGYLEICNKEGLVHRHELQFVAIPHALGDYVGTKKQSWKPCIEGSLESCKELAKYYVQTLVDSLNGRFPNLDFFNSTRLFSPCHYLEDVHDREQNSKRWLEKLFQHLQHTSCEREESKTTFDFEACLKELHAFVDTLRVNCEGSSMKDAWRIFCVTELHTNFPNMSKLWKAILSIPASTLACER